MGGCLTAAVPQHVYLLECVCLRGVDIIHVPGVWGIQDESVLSSRAEYVLLDEPQEYVGLSEHEQGFGAV